MYELYSAKIAIANGCALALQQATAMGSTKAATSKNHPWLHIFASRAPGIRFCSFFECNTIKHVLKLGTA